MGIPEEDRNILKLRHSNMLDAVAIEIVGRVVRHTHADKLYIEAKVREFLGCQPSVTNVKNFTGKELMEFEGWTGDGNSALRFYDKLAAKINKRLGLEN